MLSLSNAVSIKSGGLPTIVEFLNHTNSIISLVS